MDIVSVHGIQALARARRRDLGLTQSDVAARARLTRKWLSEFERGVASAAELPRILRLLATLDLRLEVRNVEADQDSDAVEGLAGDCSRPDPVVDLDALLRRYGHNEGDADRDDPTSIDTGRSS